MKMELRRKTLMSFVVVCGIVLLQLIPVYAQVSIDAEQDAMLEKQYGDSVSSKDSKSATGETTRNVTLDFKEADILLVLRLLSLKSGVNIVAGPEVQGTVTVRLNDVPWDKALDIVLRTYGYVYERDGNIIRVTTRENLAAEDLVTEAFILNYSTADEIEDAISEIISERGRIKAVQRTNTVIVTDIATNIYKIGEIIKRLDKRTPQVYIDSKVVRTSATNTHNLGIDWSVQANMNGASRDTTFPFKSRSLASDHWDDQLKEFFPFDLASTTEDIEQSEGSSNDTTEEEVAGIKTLGTLSFNQFSATLNLLRSFQSTKVVSNPRIVTLSNQTAKVQVGQEIGIPTFERNESTGSFEVTGFEMREIGIILNVTPHVNDANEILVELQPEITSFDEFLEYSSTLQSPQFTVTKAETQVLIMDGETIAIGGLISNEGTETRKKVPVLGDIPGVGRFFRSMDNGTGSVQTETIFFVTVTIVDTEGQPEFVEI